MRDQDSFLRRTDDLRHTIPVREYYYQKLIAHLSPFHSISMWVRVQIALLDVWIFITEKMTGSRLYVENNERELFVIDARIRTLLLSLIEQGIVLFWDRVFSAPSLPPLTQYRIQIAPYALPSGQVATIQNNVGAGTGNTENEALIPALAEVLERQSVSVWNLKDLIWGTFEDLRSQGVVPPDLFSYFSETQKAIMNAGSTRLPLIDNTTWVRARSLTTNKKHLVPAQLVYILFTRDYPSSPYFWNTSTNGAAASSTYEQAVYRAICETIERDGLMGFWLNTLAPPSIDLDTIPYPKVRQYVAMIRKYKLEVHILDITTDLGVPSFCAVLIDRYGAKTVSMSAVADYDIQSSLEKLLREVLKYPIDASKSDAVGDRSGLSTKRALDTSSFESRRFYWSGEEMIPQIDFFLKGRKVAFSEIQVDSDVSDIQSKLDRLKRVFREKKYNCFIVDVTSQSARRVGLRVVKALVPQLIPVHFNESEKSLGSSRLYAFPVVMGYRESVSTEADINVIPHPFI